MAAVLVGAGLPAAAAASPFPEVIVLPGATSAEGIATGAGSAYFAGDLFQGDIYRGDLRSGSAELFVDAPTGRMAGHEGDVRHDLLFVAGGFGGQGYVYDASTGADVAVVTLSDPTLGTAINDVALTTEKRGSPTLLSRTCTASRSPLTGPSVQRPP